jgi:Zn-dependent protease
MAIDPATLLLRFGVMIASLSVHEFAHAATAHWLGDRLPQKQGRLTLNPAAHIDPIGTLLMPAIQALTGIPTIGWARPVMVNVHALRRFKSQRLSHALVAAAGPLSNLTLALISVAILVVGGLSMPRAVIDALVLMFTANVGLFVFNLLPIPGLDGSRLLPASLDSWQRKVQPYGWAILLVIVAVPALREVIVGVPVRFITRAILSPFGLSLQ